MEILKTLIESQSADEISAQASTNLQQNKWNKNDLLPLTSDLKKLNIFLQTTSEEAYNALKLNQYDSLSYNTLKEALYVQIILLNRRRPAEVAQLTVHTFKNIDLETDKNNEFQKCLTETEKILLHTYSRFVIRGKRGRGVPVLLSPDMKRHFDYLIEVRHNFISDNEFVFHTNGKHFLDGTKVIHKYVSKCNLERPTSITATRLRKHLATITQLLQFSDSDMEQLSKFMGHTLKTHCGFYRMSDKIYQTAKVSKLLLLMMDGGAEEFKGKSLDEIQIDLNPIYDKETSLLENDTENSIGDREKCLLINDTAPNIVENNKKMTSKSNKNDKKNKMKVTERVAWTKQQKTIIKEDFSQNIKDKKPPKQQEIIKFVQKYPLLFGNKKWTSIKAVVYNMYSGKLKY